MLKPTVFGSFPGFFTKIYDKVMEKIAERSQILQSAIEYMIDVKRKNYIETGAVKHLVYDTLFFNHIKKLLGGRIRWMVSGGAPLSEKI